MAEYDIPAAARDSLPRKLSTHADVISLSVRWFPPLPPKLLHRPPPSILRPPPPSYPLFHSLPHIHRPRLRSLELQTNSYIGGKCLYGTCGRFLDRKSTRLNSSHLVI